MARGDLSLSHLLGALSPFHPLLTPLPTHFSFFFPNSGAALHFKFLMAKGESAKELPLLKLFSDQRRGLRYCWCKLSGPVGISGTIRGAFEPETTGFLPASGGIRRPVLYPD